MKVSLIQYPQDGDLIAGEAAAECYNSKDPIKALEHALKGGHESVIEHLWYTFRVEGVTRVLLAQLTRHRLMSFSVQSQRYVFMGTGERGFTMPDSIPNNLQEKAVDIISQICEWYDEAVQAGVPKEDARFLYPQGIQTKLTMSCNARELKHFLSLRCCNRAQWEIRELADEMFKLAYPTAPLIFGNAGPGCIRGACPEAKPCGHPRNIKEWTD